MANTLEPEERRNDHVKIYLTRQEHDNLTRASQAEDMSESEFGRGAIRYIINMMTSEDK